MLIVTTVVMIYVNLIKIRRKECNHDVSDFAFVLVPSSSCAHKSPSLGTGKAKKMFLTLPISRKQRKIEMER